MRLAGVFLLMGAAACAQTGPPQPEFPGELKRFLELTDAQAQAIQKLNADSDELAVRKAQRASQVQGEIVEVSAPDPIEVSAIGMRYVELEVIRRELRDELVRMRAKVLELLTPAQRARQQALEEAMNLHLAALQAQYTGVLAPPAETPNPFYGPSPAYPNLFRSYVEKVPGGSGSGSCSGYYGTGTVAGTLRR